MSFNFNTLYRNDINENYFSSHSLTTNLNVRSKSFLGKNISFILREKEEKNQLAENIQNYIEINARELKSSTTTSLDLAIKNLGIISKHYYETENAIILSAISKLTDIRNNRELLKQNFFTHYGTNITVTVFQDPTATVIMKRSDNQQQLLQQIANNYSFNESCQELGKAVVNKYLEELYPNSGIRNKFKTGESVFGLREQQQLRTYHRHRDSFISMKREIDKSFGRGISQAILETAFHSKNNLFTIEDKRTFTSKVLILASQLYYARFKKEFSEEINLTFEAEGTDLIGFEAAIKKGDLLCDRALKKAIKLKYLLSIKNDLKQKFNGVVVDNLFKDEKEIHRILRIRKKEDLIAKIHQYLLKKETIQAAE